MSPTPATGDVFIIEDAPSLEPRLVEKLRGQSIASLAAGFTRTAVLTNPGTAQSITHAIDQLAPLDAQVAQVGFGGRHMAVRTHSSQVYTLGDNSYGQLGHGDTARSDAPRLLVQLQHVPVSQVACGQYHSLALAASGAAVYAWGRGHEGQLGLGELEVALCPRSINSLHGTPIAQVAAGGSHSAALAVDGAVFCWGEALAGAVGTGRRAKATTPQKVGGLPSVRSVECGCAPRNSPQFCCAILRNSLSTPSTPAGTRTRRRSRPTARSTRGASPAARPPASTRRREPSAARLSRNRSLKSRAEGTRRRW